MLGKYLLKGTDPEFFLYKDINGRKEYQFPPKWLLDEPFEVPDVGRVVADGMAIEVHVIPDVDIDVVRNSVLRVLRDFQLETGLKIYKNDALILKGSLSDIEKRPGAYPEALNIGCDPFYTMRTNRQRPFRREHSCYMVSLRHMTGHMWESKGKCPCRSGVLFTAGGHVHIELPEPLRCADGAAYFMMTTNPFVNLYRRGIILNPEIVEMNGNPDIVLCFRTEALQDIRRNSFRVKPYGVEMRAPSNKWIYDQEEYRKFKKFFGSKVEEIAFSVSVGM